MARRALAVALLALCAGACATERHTTYVTADAPRRPAMVGVTDVQLTAEARVACDSYGVPRDTANYGRCVRDEFAARRPG